jgi:hypothetical protein
VAGRQRTGPLFDVDGGPPRHPQARDRLGLKTCSYPEAAASDCAGGAGGSDDWGGAVSQGSAEDEFRGYEPIE